MRAFIQKKTIKEKVILFHGYSKPSQHLPAQS